MSGTRKPAFKADKKTVVQQLQVHVRIADAFVDI